MLLLLLNFSVETLLIVIETTEAFLMVRTITSKIHNQLLSSNKEICRRRPINFYFFRHHLTTIITSLHLGISHFCLLAQQCIFPLFKMRHQYILKRASRAECRAIETVKNYIKKIFSCFHNLTIYF